MSISELNNNFASPFNHTFVQFKSAVTDLEGENRLYESRGWTRMAPSEIVAEVENYYQQSSEMIE